MEINHVEYIQDIAFNDTCDKMAISTTSQKIIIYQKVNKKSNELIVVEKELKDNKDNTKDKNGKKGNDNNKDDNKKKEKYKSPQSTKNLKNNSPKAEKIKQNGKDKVNSLSRFTTKKKGGHKLNDSMEIRNITMSPKSMISLDSDESKKSKQYIEKNGDEGNFFRARNPNLFKSIDFAGKNNYKLDRINMSHFDDPNDNSFDSLDNSHSFYTKSKEFDYRWEKIYSLFIDGPALRLQWARSEFGNILACGGYNKCVYILKEEKMRNNTSWRCSSQIKEFTDSVEDLSFVPKNHSLLLATLSSDGSLKLFNPLNNETNWQLKQSLNISKNGCTCLCCNPSNLDKLTIVIGCKKGKLSNEIKNEKNKPNEDSKALKIQETVKNKINGLIKIVYFMDINNPIKGIINEYGHEDDITDVDWANQNGRTYHMICSTSKDGKFIIWEIHLLIEEMNNEDDDDDNDNNEMDKNNFFSYKKMFEYKHPKPLWRCSFNESGVMVSCVDEDGEVLVFYKIGKNKFIKLDIHKK